MIGDDPVHCRQAESGAFAHGLGGRPAGGVDKGRVDVFDQAVDFIHRLSALGCRFALDDFGSGLSSFEYLRKLPVSAVKIDGSFVEDVASDPVCRAMVDAIQRVSAEMNLKTVAEKVETEADLQVLREIGVDYVQGYVLHRPEPLEQLRIGGVAGGRSSGMAARY